MSKYNRVIDSKFSQVIDPYDAQFGIRDVGKKLWKRGADDITKLIKKNRPRLSKSRVDTKSYTRALPSGSPGDIVDVPVKALPGGSGPVTPTSRMPRSDNDQAWPLGRQGAPAPASRGQRALPPGKPGDIAPIKPDYSNVPMQRPDSTKSANAGDDFVRRQMQQSNDRYSTEGYKQAAIRERVRSNSGAPGDVIDVLPPPRQEIHSPEFYEQAAARNRAARAARRQSSVEPDDARAARLNESWDKFMEGRNRSTPNRRIAESTPARQQGWINPKSVGGAAAAATTVGAGAYGLNRMMKKKKEEEEDGYEQG
jgi:hypothetical protein